MDDVAVFARGHDVRPGRIIRGAQGTCSCDSARSVVVLVGNDIDAALGSSVGSDNNAVCAILGDGTETGLLVFNTTA